MSTYPFRGRREDLIFPNAVEKSYEPNNLLKRVLHPALSSLGLPKTGWRAFRRTIATALSEMRVPKRTAQRFLATLPRKLRWPSTFSRSRSPRRMESRVWKK
jgi:hypothetical protein